MHGETIKLPRHGIWEQCLL